MTKLIDGARASARWTFRCLRGALAVCSGCGRRLGAPFEADLSPCACRALVVLEGGAFAWEVAAANRIVTTGLNKLLDAALKSGLASPTWYVGLKDTGAIVAGDIMSSHAGWATITPYSNATDPAYVLGAISGGAASNSGSTANFNINATDDVYGGFIKDDATKSGATGTLFSVVDAASPLTVQGGEVLQVTVSQTLTSA